MTRTAEPSRGATVTRAEPSTRASATRAAEQRAADASPVAGDPAQPAATSRPGFGQRAVTTERALTVVVDRATLIGLVVALIAALLYRLTGRDFDAGRPDFYYLADAFLHGRTWLEFDPGQWDVIRDGGRFYLPFAPFPAIALMPVVALVGPTTAAMWASRIDATLAGVAVFLCWVMLGRVGVSRLSDRLWLIMLFAFSTPLWWVTMRGGVWHTGQILATVLTLACLVELWGRARPLLVGLLAGAAFITRAPLAFAVPFYALLGNGWEGASTRTRTPISGWPWRRWAVLAAGTLPSVALFFWYNAVRFGSPLESGYALAALPPWLEVQRAQGLFSVSHIAMNIDEFLLHLPRVVAEPPFLKPDGFGLSVLLTSPGLLVAARADWRQPKARLLLGAAAAVLVPTLLYYGGGWLQYGYRYFLDSIPFVMALAGMAVARMRHFGWGWKALIVFGIVVNAGGWWWLGRF